MSGISYFFKSSWKGDEKFWNANLSRNFEVFRFVLCAHACEGDVLTSYSVVASYAKRPLVELKESEREREEEE